VDGERFAPSRRTAALRAEWGAGEDDVVLLCVGRLAPEKNLALAVEALRDVRAVLRDARLVLVGDGPSRGLWRSEPGVHLAGLRRDLDLARHYACADLFLMPSRTETFGNVLLEAMASGLPVVAFDEAAAALHVEDGREGRKAPPGDAGAFRAAARDLALDGVLRRRMGAAARARAAALGWDRIAERYESLVRAELPERP
jgi:glycosyltransferase involved in cell wall biosynthesis